MATLACLFHLTASYPLWRAWRANRDTSLRYAVGWAILAWTGWAGVVGLGALSGPGWGLRPARLLALALTSAAVVAVLGARRPGVTAWNFVVLGLLAVMLLPLIEQLVAGGQPLDPVRAMFLCGTLAVGLLNYLPTRLAPAVLVLGLGCGWEAWTLLAPEQSGLALSADGRGWLWIALSPWVGWLALRLRPAVQSEFDHLWLDFRDRFGLVWGQRLREQFNRVADHAGWPVHLSWQGLRLKADAASPDEAGRNAILAALRALLKRFRWQED
jgi:hypothetical protein